jgi:RES domain-containing protein
MQVWRLTMSATPDEAFDGAGAARFGGRWNRPGTRVIYTASRLSLAALEQLVHAHPDRIKRPFFAYAVDVPDTFIEDLASTTLPAGWNAPTAPPRLAEIGTDWARSLRILALRMPSAVVPQELNVILNCDHPDFSKLTFPAGEPFRFDQRLLKTAA